ncbi:carbon monoxide dehydrogenase subunit G [Hoeflea sp.]|uniref:CoxG family protein n=1 Tax=Hoeflea sp. TaxID=1940281 RepID=UPI0019C85D27|nr:carbon monoxide dehydrogenase subunit G [Hoeflea sp.]MBC7284429.1 carbon monoxide dehydrogenase subunit G [Hoeflea sp.]
MELNDEIRIKAPVSVVYAALNDPAVLMACIPGCEELIRCNNTELEAKVTLKIGPMKARFSGTVTLDTAGAPHRFSITGVGNGGIAGFAKGGADVVLEADGVATKLKYLATADIGGKMAQLGSRLVQSTASKLSGQFFARFVEIVELGSETMTRRSRDEVGEKTEF